VTDGPASAGERLEVLEMVERGLISPQEGVALLEALGGRPGAVSEEGAAQAEFDDTPASPASGGPPASPAPGDWLRWRQFPLWVGAAVTVAGGLGLYAALRLTGQMGFWFYCAWLPFLLGVGITTLAWFARESRWVYLRVRQKPGRRPAQLSLSFPLPLRSTAWFIRRFGHHIPDLQYSGVDELLLALEQGPTPQEPLYLEVLEGEDGEQVQVFIG
jgi:hypothetical protein